MEPRGDVREEKGRNGERNKEKEGEGGRRDGEVRGERKADSLKTSSMLAFNHIRQTHAFFSWLRSNQSVTCSFRNADPPCAMRWPLSVEDFRCGHFELSCAGGVKYTPDGKYLIRVIYTDYVLK